MKSADLTPAFLIGASLFLTGCNKQAENSDQAWTRPAKIAESLDGIIGSAGVYQDNNLVITMVPKKNRQSEWFILDSKDGTNDSLLSDVSVSGIPDGYALITIDRANHQVLLARGSEETNRLTMDFVFASLTSNTGLQIVAEKKWVMTQKSLFGETGSNVTMTSPGYGDSPLLGVGILDGSELFIPFSVNAETHSGNTSFQSHFNNGIFYSSDFGESWQMQRISDFYAIIPLICKTRNFYYYFATKGSLPSGLWFSRKPIGGDSWTPPQDVTKSFAKSLGNYDAITSDDMIHLCWLDSRDEKMRLNMDPYRANYGVAYCRRRDSDAAWNKDVILSKGLLYSYAPSMSIEGDKIVIAWAGVKTAKDWHTEHDPNDIYYVTSKDAGNSWTQPLKVTDAAKEGITSGRPKVVLLNGVIHILFVQGKMISKQESPGLRKLNQPPWPIYYQQRPFPK